MNIKSLMKKAYIGTLAAIGVAFSISPVNAYTYTCNDIVAVSKLVAGGTNWTSSQTSYAHAVLTEADHAVREVLSYHLQEAAKGKQEAKNMMALLAQKGMGENVSRRNELTLKVIQRVHLAEARVTSIVSDFPSNQRFIMCISYGLGAYAAS